MVPGFAMGVYGTTMNNHIWYNVYGTIITATTIVYPGSSMVPLWFANSCTMVDEPWYDPSSFNHEKTMVNEVLFDHGSTTIVVPWFDYMVEPCYDYHGATVHR